MVIRKNDGNVLKWNHTSGAVNSWQETDRDIEFHSRDITPPLRPDGYNARRRGYTVRIPNIARYDSWKPMESITAGLTDSCISSAEQKAASGERFRPGAKEKISLMQMNRKALIIDGEAPVIIT